MVVLLIAETTTRPECRPGDEDFLLELYRSTRPELHALGWPEPEVDALVRMQFRAQSQHYRTWYPEATFSVVLVGGQPAGRLVVARSEAGLVIVDLALLPAFRGAGVGGRLVRPLLEEADAAGRPVRCQVVVGNPARSFWEHLGFVAQGTEGVHVAMERACET